MAARTAGIDIDEEITSL